MSLADLCAALRRRNITLEERIFTRIPKMPEKWDAIEALRERLDAGIDVMLPRLVERN